MNVEACSEDEPSEHVRFAVHLQALAQVTVTEEPDLVSTVLTDPDQTMAQSAVARHLDRRAAGLCPDHAYEPWARSMAEVIARHPFLVQRLHEWSLFRAISLAQPWTPSALTDASDWLQRKIADDLDAPDALALLAEHGRTKRIRNTAKAGITRRPG
ncbi:hypothetical protein [Streptomyces inhibens]|uniref:hypothetical protein n=1 Tax=Streptomyces inhibens TaxID=2293571 RepID=UPI001EE746CA|nr:hypothetical protein [Streptomyces inhibens]UKY47519.1 hypothetical protein KI385_00740 [Streptomyces inhibens]